MCLSMCILSGTNPDFKSGVNTIKIPAVSFWFSLLWFWRKNPECQTVFIEQVLLSDSFFALALAVLAAWWESCKDFSREQQLLGKLLSTRTVVMHVWSKASPQVAWLQCFLLCKELYRTGGCFWTFQFLLVSCWTWISIQTFSALLPSGFRERVWWQVWSTNW